MLCKRMDYILTSTLLNAFEWPKRKAMINQPLRNPLFHAARCMCLELNRVSIRLFLMFL